MPRANRIWPSVYFGRPGALTTLPWPRGDLGRPYEKLIDDFVTGTGQHLVSSIALGSRPFTVNWQSMHSDSFAQVERYWTGSMGVGPWAFIDPSVNNMLLPNQAAGSNVLYDSTGFVTSTGATSAGTLTSNTSSTFIHRAGASRSMRWQFTVTAASFPQVNFDAPYRNWYGSPVVATLPYVFSVWSRPDGVVDSSITMAAKIQWFDATGGSLGDSTSGDTVMTGWTKLTVSAAAPAGAAYGRPILLATGSTITVGASIYFDEMQFEQDSITTNSWAPGTGVRPVEILSLDETSPFDAKWRKGMTMVLRELVA